MSKKRNDAAQQIADRLMAAEVALDRAVIETASLAGYLPQARIECMLAAEVGHEALEHVAATVASLIEARTRIVATHRALATARLDAGLGEVAFGGLMRKSARAAPQGVNDAA